MPARAASSSDLVILPGEEITTYHGHANVWGVTGWVDFRITRPGDVERLVEHVHRRGGLFAVNHLVTPRAASAATGNTPSPTPSTSSRPGTGLGPIATGKRWSVTTRSCGAAYVLRWWAVATATSPGGRTPTPRACGSAPTTWFHLDALSEATLLQGLAGGRAFVSEGPQGPRLDLEAEGAGMGSTVRAPAGRRLKVSASVEGAVGSLLRYVGAHGVVREVPITSERFDRPLRLAGRRPVPAGRGAGRGRRGRCDGAVRDVASAGEGTARPVTGRGPGPAPQAGAVDPVYIRTDA